MFDKVEIRVRGGDGGDGIISFRREKFTPFGGPDGGDGGGGGGVVIVAGGGITSLRQFRQKRFYRAEDGKDGKGKKKHGRKGEDLIITVPTGTVVSYKTQVGGNPLIADLEEAEQQVVVAKGGKGGLGNTHFVSSTNQAPRIAQKGETGEDTSIILELRLIADVGIIGYPNVGKSTLLAAASAAKPKIASYPFTTREPVLGVVETGQRSFVLVEIPGLIGGAHLGRGLGHDFLRHIIRTKIIIHLVDGSSPSLVEDMVQVNSELSLFDSVLAQKPQLVAINKIDLPQVRAQLAGIEDAFARVATIPFFVSAANGEGIPELMAAAMKVLDEVKAKAEFGVQVPKKVFRPQPRSIIPTVHKEGDIFVVEAPELERIVGSIDITNPGVLGKQLRRLGLSKVLHKAGVKPGDKVRCGNLEWEWR